MIALVVLTFVRKVMSLLLNMLSMILEPKKIKSVTVSIFSLSLCCEVMELDAVTIAF